VGRSSSGDPLYPWGHPTLPRSASNYVPHPFTSFALDPEHPEHNAQGLRARQVYGERTETPRILIIGGSNVYGTQVPFKDTIAVRLERELEQPVGLTEVVNGGVGAFTTANLIPHLALRLLDLQPDICIIDVGYTDMVARIRYRDFRTDLSHDYKNWDLPARPLWRRSVLFDRVAKRLGFGFETDPSIHSVCQRTESPDFDQNFQSSSNLAFERNLRTLIGICLAHGVTPVICTQATAFDAHPAESHNDTWQRAMEEANDSLVSVAGEAGVFLIDVAEGLSERGELFADGRRMNGAGNQRRAEVVAQALVDAGLLESK